MIFFQSSKGPLNMQYFQISEWRKKHERIPLLGVVEFLIRKVFTYMLNTISAKESARAQALAEWLLAWKVPKTNWFAWIICCKWNNTTVVQKLWTSLSSREIYLNKMENQPPEVDQVNIRPYMEIWYLHKDSILFGFIIMHNL